MYEFSNSENWDLVYSQNKIAESAGSGYFYPISPYLIPFQFEPNIIAAQITSPGIPSYWKFGGTIQQKIFTGILGGGLPDAELARKRLWLNKIQIIEFQKEISFYSLEIEPAKWLNEVNINIWVYTGPNMSGIEDTINLIKEKVDSL